MKYLNAILDILFPKKCINCGKRGTFLCDDCFSLIEINPFQFCLCDIPQKLMIPKCNLCSNMYLDEIYSACDANNFIFQKIIKSIKEKYLINLCIPLSLLILTHLQVINKDIKKKYLIIPVPINEKEKRRKGFSEAEEVAKIISKACSLSFSKNILIKNNDQIEIKNNIIKNKTIVLIDLIYTDGKEMNACAKLLKENKAKKIIGLVIGRG